MEECVKQCELPGLLGVNLSNYTLKMLWVDKTFYCDDK